MLHSVECVSRLLNPLSNVDLRLSTYVTFVPSLASGRPLRSFIIIVIATTLMFARQPSRFEDRLSSSNVTTLRLVSSGVLGL